MKTSNKLLLGLIIFIMLLITVTLVITKAHDPEATGFEQSNREETSTEMLLKQEESIISTIIFSPVIFLQLPRQLQ